MTMLYIYILRYKKYPKWVYFIDGIMIIYIKFA